MKTIVPVTSALALALFMTGAVAAPAFDTLDADKNGSLNQEEAAAMDGLVVVFGVLDVDGDKQLTQDEYSYVLGNESSPLSLKRKAEEGR